MTGEEIEIAVLQRMDEVGADNDAENYPITAMTTEAVDELLRIVPLRHFKASDFSDEQLTASSDGPGSISVPSDFVRLISFKMEGWERPVTTLNDAEEDSFKKQFHKITRGGVVRPKLYRRNDEFLYFSVPEGEVHQIEEALYFKKMKATNEEFPQILNDALAWLVAGKCLSLSHDNDQSAICYENYKQIISQL